MIAGMAQLEVRLPSKEKIAGSRPAARSAAPVAQWIECLASNQEVASSSLARGANGYPSPVAQSVERLTVNQEVPGSKPGRGAWVCSVSWLKWQDSNLPMTTYADRGL
jgi:hypothetical protein